MLFRTNPSLGVPIYLQLMEQVKHAIETGALRPGDQLPGMRPLAEELVINPNTVAKAYRELEHEGIIELRHGAGAFVAGNVRLKKVTEKLRAGQATVAEAIERLRARVPARLHFTGCECGHPAAHRVRERGQGTLRLHDGRGDHPLHRGILSAMAHGSGTALSPCV